MDLVINPKQRKDPRNSSNPALSDNLGAPFGEGKKRGCPAGRVLCMFPNIITLPCHPAPEAQGDNLMQNIQRRGTRFIVQQVLAPKKTN